ASRRPASRRNLGICVCRCPIRPGCELADPANPTLVARESHQFGTELLGTDWDQVKVCRVGHSMFAKELVLWGTLSLARRTQKMTTRNHRSNTHPMRTRSWGLALLPCLAAFYGCAADPTG